MPDRTERNVEQQEHQQHRDHECACQRLGDFLLTLVIATVTDEVAGGNLKAVNLSLRRRRVLYVGVITFTVAYNHTRVSSRRCNSDLQAMPASVGYEL